MNGSAFSGISVWRAVFRLRLPFAHHLAARDRVETLLVEIRAANGGIGHGQALPRAYLTGESLETAFTAIREVYWPALKNTAIPESADREAVFASIRPLYRQADARGENAAWAALDVAALDAFASGRGEPLSRLLPDAAKAARGTRLPLVGVLPATGPRKIYWLVRLLRFLGYRRFKVKVGLDAPADARRLEAARRAAGPGAWLAVDANGAWTREEALRRGATLRRHGVSLIEEPLRREEAAETDFADLEGELGVPIMADESLCSLADARRLLARGTPSWWNLRLAKIGGFSGWRELSRMAGERGVKIYGGILVGETSLLAAASREIWGKGGAVCGEYGFPRIFLAGDPFRGGPGGFMGSWPAGESRQAGLGVRLASRRLYRTAELLWRDGERGDGPEKR